MGYFPRCNFLAYIGFPKNASRCVTKGNSRFISLPGNELWRDAFGDAFLFW
jgi:hypothetical protein